MKKLLVAAAMFVFGITIIPASAQYRPRYDEPTYHSQRRGHAGDINYMQRQVREEISMGIRRGELSRREANALMNRYEHISAKERKFSHRGRLSPREARIIREDLERLMADTRRMSDRRGDGWAREHRRRY